MDQDVDFFVSRAGPDAEIAQRIAQILESVGKRVLIQDWDFKNRSFMERMDVALRSGARVIAILSPDYLTWKQGHCQAEWMNTIADDPLNCQGRLVLFRIRPCAPDGLLKSLAYWDLVPLLADAAANANLLRDVVLAAVHPGSDRRPTSDFARLFRPAQPVLHVDIKPTSSFTGRENELRRIGEALAGGATAVITQPVAVHGLGGIGKSTLAREYAWQNREAFTGIWWLNAEKVPDTKAWDGIEQGLIALRNALFPGTGEPEDRAQAARDILASLSAHGGEKPWLLVYDNVNDARVLDAWPPPEHVRVLMTSRLGNWRGTIAGIEVETWTLDEAIRYLKHESSRNDLTEAEARRVAETLGCLPLALSHAAAYLRDVGNASPHSYLAALARHMGEVPESADYPRAVFATLLENVRQAEERAPGAIAVLSLAAFYAPDAIPEELFRQRHTYLPELAVVIGDAPALEKAIGALDRLSVIDFRPETRSFSVHRLVQAAVRDSLGAAAWMWSVSAVCVCAEAWPNNEFEHWPTCERLLPHAHVATFLNGDSFGPAVSILLNKMGLYLHGRASFAEAIPLFNRALTTILEVFGPEHDRTAVALSNLCTAPGFSDTRRRYAASKMVAAAAIHRRLVSAGLR